MKRWIWIVLVVLGTLPFTAVAQDDAVLPELTETYTTDTFHMNYPADWTPGKEVSVFSIPLAGEGAVGDGIAIQRDDLTATFTLVSGEKLTAHDLAVQVAGDSAEGIPDYRQGVLLDVTVNGREASFVDVLGLFPVRFVTLALGNDQYLQVMLVGVTEQFTAVLPTLWAVFDTVRLTEDDAPQSESLVVHYTLVQDYQRKDYWDFSIPADWTTQEAETYTLLIIPGMETTIGVSLVRDDNAANPHIWGDQVYQNVMASAPDAEYEEMDITIGDFPALQQNFSITDQNLGYTQFITYGGEDVQINVSVIGPLSEIPVLTPVIRDIIATVVIGYE